ncbi:hypothetical protein [Rahnella ecdela]|uniref:Uncharacterized protein n=1 Tax=Rahnella ecdela TaxID=2816250 RepID=A0ABS6LGL0_9GAMM|nr:hypothetical protein [Rahnella ecdela]MBU9845952.1 hypothetical protein [Rahnella ecdela]
MKINIIVFFLFVIAMACDTSCASPYCEEMRGKFSDEQIDSLKINVSRQLMIGGVTIISLFKKQKWSVAYVETDFADDVFLFYHGDVYKDNFITTWSGVAEISEEHSIAKWAEDNATGIPEDLAECFAWYLTHGRNEN